MSQIELKNVSKHFITKSLGKITAVNNFNLNIEKGECFSFLGPSGCGKTTTLRMIAGFEDLSEGSIKLGDKLVSSSDRKLYVPPEERGLGMVFQSFAVWPHMNIFENVAFPLRVKKLPKSEIIEKVKVALKHTSLSGMEEVYPGKLSGGQQQRIALARAIVTNPEIMLLDEPLSNLDPKLRETMRFEIKELQKKYDFTIIFVTHDQSEAMVLSDRMLVMDMGNIVQIGTPDELYNKPVNKFVHSFLGQSSFIKVYVKDGHIYPTGENNQYLKLDIDTKNKTEGIIATRPNEIEINKTEGFKTRIEKRVLLTSYAEYYVKIGDNELKIQTPHRNMFEKGEECFIRIKNPVWYNLESDDLEKERNRRQLI